MTQHTRYLSGWEMPFDQKKHIAKQVAQLLADGEATVDDMFDVFQLVREYLVVCKRPEKKKED